MSIASTPWPTTNALTAGVTATGHETVLPHRKVRASRVLRAWAKGIPTKAGIKELRIPKANRRVFPTRPRAKGKALGLRLAVRAAALRANAGTAWSMGTRRGIALNCKPKSNPWSRLLGLRGWLRLGLSAETLRWLRFPLLLQPFLGFGTSLLE